MILIYRRNMNITKDKIESLLGANKDIAVEANAGILFMSRNQNAGQIHNIIRSNKLYEGVEILECLRTTVKLKNCTYVDNENRLN